MSGATLSRAEAAWEALNKHRGTPKSNIEQVVRQLVDTQWSALTIPAKRHPEGIIEQYILKKASGNAGTTLIDEQISKSTPVVGFDSAETLENQLRQDGKPPPECSTSSSEATSLSQRSREPAPSGVMEANLVREVNALTDPSAAIRKRALTQLRRLMLGEGRTELRLGKDELQGIAEDHILKPLLRRFGDSSSACRELALELTLGLLEEVPDAVLSLLPYAIPALGERLARYDAADSASAPETTSRSQKTSTSESTDSFESKDSKDSGAIAKARKRGSGPVEEVEENRLLLARLLRSLLKHAGKAIGAYAADVGAMLTSSVADLSPEVAQELCLCVEDYGKLLGVRLRQVAKPMIAAVTPLLGAKRQKVRCAGLRAIRKLVACGGAEAILDLTGFRDPNLIPIKAFYEADIKTNWFALLALDPTVAVRREFLATLGDWLLNLPERMDHETRLLPYVLSAFSDDNPSIQLEAFELMEAIGRQYEREKADELKDTQYYLPEEAGAEGLHLSPPFTRRPCLGARICVRGCFNRLVLPLVAELRAWTTGTKDHAIDLLTTMLTYAEEGATQHVQPILLAFLQLTDDLSIAEKVHDCCQILGTFVPPSAYLLVLLPRIQGEVGEADAAARARALHLLARLLAAAPSDGIRSVLPDVTSCLTEPELLNARSGRLRTAVASVTSAVVSAWERDGGGEWGEELIPMLWILLNVAAREDHDRMSEDQVQGLSNLEHLARAEGFPTAAGLLSAHLDSILALLSPAATWHEQTPDLAVFSLVKDHVAASGDSETAKRLAAFEEDAKSSPAYDAIQSRLQQR
ncbi:hypothetical protein KFL_002860170 [Klebsormidium nitens]|uniref:Uncharacterized protein n=1 Tax=Klebsormidium nitens TaxID=105231 RepID=A0A1Y1I797_KLENI|nr:hypothetical protein KFL_002860170 [Klebsormidium nitens]|eukprot:GAQ86393.1 hypothetical protein KFL_002860170 [Klebsormidium nitens]